MRENRAFIEKLSYIQSLFRAVEDGDEKKVRIILSLDRTVPCWLRNKQGETLWHVAMKQRDAQKAKAMLDTLLIYASKWATITNFEGKTFVEYGLIMRGGETDILEYCRELINRTIQYEKQQETKLEAFPNLSLF